MKLQRLLPWLAAVVALGAALTNLAPPAKIRGFDVASFSKLPVLEGGRVKPIDSVARNSLLMIRSNTSFTFQGRTMGPDEWLMDVLFRPEVADQEPVFFINDPEVLGLMGMKQEANRYYPFAALQPHLDDIQTQADAAHKLDAKQRSRFQNAIVNLFERVYLYYRLKNTLSVDGAGGLQSVVAALQRPEVAQPLSAMTELAHFRIVVPANGKGWLSTGEALQAARGGETLDPSVNQLATLNAAYLSGDASAFNGAVAELRAHAQSSLGKELGKSDAETVFNRVQPFYAGMVIYILALLTLFASWMWKRELLQPLSYGLLVAGALVHTAGLVSRVILQGRPPVTNLYSSAVFVGWGAVVLGVILERMYKKGFGTAVAAASGFASLIVAHHLAGDGDTMEMMRAVLDSNFWLATHVVTITIGYSGTFLAGAIAIAYTFRKHFARVLDPSTTKALVSMTYGVLCFSLLFSFAGTVLGGIWADQSWGRFWGWDPKENGALLIVLWNAIILHARWGGYIRERGIMAMTIGGTIITSLSWFGVNMLGVGLHSYGFMDSAFYALAAVDGTLLALMGLCLLPRKFWHLSASSDERPSGKEAHA